MAVVFKVLLVVCIASNAVFAANIQQVSNVQEQMNVNQNPLNTTVPQVPSASEGSVIPTDLASPTMVEGPIGGQAVVDAQVPPMSGVSVPSSQSLDDVSQLDQASSQLLNLFKAYIHSLISETLVKSVQASQADVVASQYNPYEAVGVSGST